VCRSGITTPEFVKENILAAPLQDKGSSRTPQQRHSISLEINIFDLKMMVKSGLEFFNFEIQ
jgi:hypothetical protein